jgi:ribonuclease T1
MVNALVRAALILTIGCSSLLVAPAEARAPKSTSAIPVVSIRSLPIEAQETIQLINQGGPFPYRKDGTVFGTYREYTVPTPGQRTRGARRIIATPRLKYYTPDHYRSFQQVQE